MKSIESYARLGRTVEPLKKLLASLDDALAQKAPDKAESLAPGAKKAALAKLPAPELATLFAWHDGQKNTKSLTENRYLHSIAEARDASKFLAREGKSFEKSWFPVFTNGAGDYVVLETAKGKRHGALVAYWHDDAARPVEHASLSAWAESMLAELAKMPVAKKKAAANATPDLAALPIAIDAAWTAAPKPRVSDAAKAPVGTMYRCEHVAMIAGGSPPVLHVYLKVSPATWLRFQCKVDVDTIAAQILEKLRAPPKKWGPPYAQLDDAAFVKFLTKTSLTRWMKVDGKWDTHPHDELFTTRATLG